MTKPEDAPVVMKLKEGFELYPREDIPAITDVIIGDITLQFRPWLRWRLCRIERGFAFANELGDFNLGDTGGWTDYLEAGIRLCSDDRLSRIIALPFHIKGASTTADDNYDAVHELTRKHLSLSVAWDALRYFFADRSQILAARFPTLFGGGANEDPEGQRRVDKLKSEGYILSIWDDAPHWWWPLLAIISENPLDHAKYYEMEAELVISYAEKLAMRRKEEEKLMKKHKQQSNRRK